MGFLADDIEPAGRVPNSAVAVYVVRRDGRPLGLVHVPVAPVLAREGRDVIAWIVGRLDDLEAALGLQQLSFALRQLLLL